jgi:hypothetical protein
MIVISARDTEQKNKFLGLTSILGVAVEATEYRSQSLIASEANKVIIFGVPIEVEDDELLSESKAVEVKRLQKRDNDNQLSPTGTVILKYFETPPDKILIGWRYYKTKTYIPPPTQCFKCRLFGHIASSCRGKLTCPRCSMAHDIKDCPCKTVTDTQEIDFSTFKCPNCAQHHSAGYKGCPAYVKAKEISEIKFTNKTTYAEALKLHAKKQVAISRNSVSNNHLVNSVNNFPSLTINRPSITNSTKLVAAVPTALMSRPVDTSTPSRAARPESSSNSSVNPIAQVSLHNGSSDTNVVLLNLVVYLIKILSADSKFEDIINQISLQCGLSGDKNNIIIIF